MHARLETVFQEAEQIRSPISESNPDPIPLANSFRLVSEKPMRFVYRRAVVRAMFSTDSRAGDVAGVEYLL